MAVLELSLRQGDKSVQKKILKKQKKAMLVAQDLNYARNLAANEEKVRLRSLKYLKKYLTQRTQANSIEEDNLKVLWKGLFYSMWMSDKPLVQEECAENIANLIHCFQFNEAMLFFKVGLLTLQNEWFGIDHLRLDKFLMFVRRLLRQAFVVLKKHNFRSIPNKAFADVLEATILSTTHSPPLSLLMHFTEIYLEELAKVSDGKLDSSRTLDFLKPYIFNLAFASDERVISSINKFIFMHLIKQHKLGLEYEEKYKVWRAQRFAGSIDQIQKVVLSGDEIQEDEVREPLNKPLDPRAGRVDVVLPQIRFNAKDVSSALLIPKNDPKTSKKTRKCLTVWSEKFQKIHNGMYPLGIKKLKSKKRKHVDNYDTNITKAAKRLIKFEQKLLSVDGQGNKKKRKISEVSYPDEELAGHTSKKRKHEKLPNTVNNPESFQTKKLKKESPKMKKSQKIKNNYDKHVDSTNTKKKKHGKLSPKRNLDLSDSLADDSSYTFRRTSGIWFVEKGSLSPVTSDLSKPELSKTKNKRSADLDGKELLSNSGETQEFEIFIPAKKYVKKLKATVGNKETEKILNKLRGKSQVSQSHTAKLGQFTPKKIRSSTPGSPKKVVINTMLNVSQDIDDHILQVMASPQVPWDSSKKPARPVLKTPIKPSPVNPFYKLKTY